MSVKILVGDVLEQLALLPDDHFDVVVTSPPYWGLRDYGVAGQLGLEPTLGEHIANMVGVFGAIRRVLKPTGIVWVNYGDCYATSPNGRSAAATKALGEDDRTFRDKPFSTVGPIYEAEHEKTSRVGKGANKGSVAAAHGGRVVAGGFLKPKDLCMVPNRIAIALQDDGWWVRSETVWGKLNPMPESVTDRPAASHEKVFLLTKSERYSWDEVAARQGGRPDSVERYHRGRSDHHKWADGGPGGQSIAKSFDGMAAKHPKPTRGRDTHGRHTLAENMPPGAARKPRSDKQAAAAAATIPGSKGRRQAGFNERWDAKEASRRDSFARETKATAGTHGQKPQHQTDREDVSYRNGTRNLRNFEPAPLQVWTISTAPFGGEFCCRCENYFQGVSLRKLRVEKIELEGGAKETRRYCSCGSHSDWLSHFATFPAKLVEMALRPVYPRCCATCGSPWEREVAKTFVAQADVSAEKSFREDHQHDPSSGWGGGAARVADLPDGADAPHLQMRHGQDRPGPGAGPFRRGRDRRHGRRGRGPRRHPDRAEPQVRQAGPRPHQDRAPDGGGRRRGGQRRRPAAVRGSLAMRISDESLLRCRAMAAEAALAAERAFSAELQVQLTRANRAAVRLARRLHERGAA